MKTLPRHQGHGTPCPYVSRLPNRRGTARRALLQIAAAHKDVQRAGQPMGTAVSAAVDERFARYMFRGRGGVFRNPEHRHSENPLKLVQVAARAYPAYFAPALAQIEALATSEIHRIFSALPSQRASPMAQAFAESFVLRAQAALMVILK